MQHSIIVKFFIGIFEYTKKFYRFSFAKKMINGVTISIRRFFENSLLYKLFNGGNGNARKFIGNSLIGRIEVLLQKIISFFNPMYHAGVKGSRTINNTNKVLKGKSKVGTKVIAFIIVGAVIAFNLLSLINKSINSEQVYISAIIVFISINLYFIDMSNLYRNSFIKKIVDGIFHV